LPLKVRDAVLGDLGHQLAAAAEAAQRGAAADRLGEALEVGGDAVDLLGAAVGDGGAGLDLVPDEDDAVAAAAVADRLQVAGLGVDDADVHHHRLHDHPGDLAGVGRKQPVQRLGVVVGDDQGQVGDRLGGALAELDAGGGLPRPHVVPARPDRHQHRLMVAVVGALDLDDLVAAGDTAGQPDGVHGGLGARVGEAHLVDPEAPAQLLGQQGRLGHRLGEVGADGGALGQGRDDLGMGVADGHHAEAVVVVGVLVAVDVPDPAAAGALEEDRVRRGVLEAGGDPQRQRLEGALTPLARLGGPLVDELGAGLGERLDTLLVGPSAHADHPPARAGTFALRRD
jgi:hypothetical protein